LRSMRQHADRGKGVTPAGPELRCRVGEHEGCSNGSISEPLAGGRHTLLGIGLFERRGGLRVCGSGSPQMSIFVDRVPTRPGAEPFSAGGNCSRRCWSVGWVRGRASDQTQSTGTLGSTSIPGYNSPRPWTRSRRARRSGRDQPSLADLPGDLPTLAALRKSIPRAPVAFGVNRNVSPQAPSRTLRSVIAQANIAGDRCRRRT